MAPLLRNRQVFTQRWQIGLVPGRNAAMPAEVEVFTRELTTVNNTTTSVETDVYTGIARIQPIRSAQRNGVPGGVSVDQVVRFQVVLNDLRFVADQMLLRVTACELNESLVNDTIYVLNETTDSSNPIERTFDARLETKSG